MDQGFYKVTGLLGKDRPIICTGTGHSHESVRAQTHKRTDRRTEKRASLDKYAYTSMQLGPKPAEIMLPMDQDFPFQLI